MITADNELLMVSGFPSPLDMSEMSNFQIDDIHIRYHPNSCRSPLTESFSQYISQNTATPPICNRQPWLPFHSEAEFTFAEITLQTAMSNKQLDALIAVVHKLIKGGEAFKLKSHRDVQDLWDGASKSLTPFVKHIVTVPYHNQEKEFEFWGCSLWDWATNIMEDPRLAAVFEWDAKRLYRFDGKSKLPPEAKPFCITLYADKTRLSSFGTVQGYPIMAQCTNLPREIRNGKGLGATQIVGWLPIVPEDKAESGKPGFVNFKRVVWHESFRILLETISKHSYTGCWLNCGDRVSRKVYPFVFILSADYEEQCVMALIRGEKGLYPCPFCLVPRDEQADLAKTHTLRTAEHAQEIFNAGLELTAAEHEDLLKSIGLRNVENAFWSVQFSDPHQALAWDHMHNYSYGLGGKHIWPKIQNHIEELVHFSDAKKYEDILKMLIFVSHNVLTEKASPLGYLMLRCLQSYLNLDMWVSMEIQTEDTLEAGHQELLRFSRLIAKYTAAASAAFTDIEKVGKNFNFPKMHAHQHVFDHIRDKGATYIYSTKLFERLHHALKKWYQLRTNFRDIAPQILRADHHMLTSSEDTNNTISIISHDLNATLFGNITLGAPEKPCSFREFEITHQQDPAFERFRLRLALFLDTLLRQDDSPVLSISLITTILFGTEYEQFIEYCFIKSHYLSMVDWKQTTDYLRCSPNFFSKERYDCVLVHSSERDFFARLLHVFTFTFEDITLPIGLILPMSEIKPLRRKDKELNLHRLRPIRQANATFISLWSIIRGVFLVPECTTDGDLVVVDIVDTDMFLRIWAMYPPIHN
ncbi:hypothetical protein BDZ94DRAFT_1329905 [Collybia nuda]|uniref:Uncharacterized protein n=1 Tax=Collybia nuda TaxID=64659 RepID=A0A9P5YHJ5_9AGAR|nr:hypothetical protein BDZ94DRAFT_1329905 [Collybia nuda]